MRRALKQQITIRHLLNHTSGLQNVPNAGAESYPSPDAVRLALAAELEAEPGRVFSYNNKAVNLLAGIIESERDAALESTLGAEWQSVLEQHTGGSGEEEIFVREYSPIVAFYGDGYLGQTLLVVPDHGIMAVRQVPGGEGYNTETDGFPDFKRLVLGLAER